MTQTTILVMDDEELLRESMALYLENKGFAVLQAGDGRQGLEIFLRQRPDLVLVDLRMPEINGMEVLARLREIAPETPALVVSGAGVLHDALEAIRLGAWDFVTKPIADMDVLLHAVRKALERARLMAENARYQQGLESEIAARTRDLEEAGRRLEEQNLFLSTLIESIPSPLFYQDRQGRFLGCNESFCRLVGRDRPAVVGRVAQAVFPPTQNGVFGHADMDELARRGPVAYETAFVGPCGGLRHLAVGKSVFRDASGRPAGLVGVLSDMTAHKRLEDRLRESEARYRLLVDTLPGGIVELDKNGMFRFANPSFETIFGYGPRECLGTHISGLAADAAGRRLLLALLRQEGEAAGSRGSFVIKGQTRNGRQLDARIDWSDKRDPGGARTGFIASITDVTALEQAREVVEQALEEKKVLLQEIHHRVKNNLQIILGFINIQADEAADAGERDRFTRLETRIRSMALIHQQLYKHGELAAIDMREYAQTLTQGLVSIFRDAMAGVRVVYDTDAFHLHLDKAVPCGLLLSELVTNACRHAFVPGQGGELRVDARLEDGQARIRVGDTGPGPPPGFDFATAQTMGTTLVRELVRQLHGEIRLRTDPGFQVEVVFPA